MGRPWHAPAEEIPVGITEKEQYVKEQVRLYESGKTSNIMCPIHYKPHLKSADPEQPEPLCCEWFMHTLKRVLAGDI